MAEQPIIRRKRIDSNGEWEFECANCGNWLDQKKFGGCKTYVDGYGNCLMCSSCRAKKVHQDTNARDMVMVEEILQKTGFRDYPSREAWFEDRWKKLFNK